FSDGGVYHQPLLITRVTDPSGKSLPLPVKPQSRVVLTPSQAAQLDYVLQQVVLRGTGVAAGHLPSEVAGKTGTTENSADAWFIGFTPHLTTAVWMGYASSIRPMGRVQGGTIPAEMWHNYMAGVLTQMPQYDGVFPTAALTGNMLIPPNGPVPATTVPTSTSSSTAPTTTATTQPPSTTSPPTTSPPTTKPTPTTKPPSTTSPPTT
ncbi:MAG TPA: penicillin-binding transpeptidase domain-containing protein, partial [Acidimicrobiales bacterium]|nr:penicillin-binding transpeptidase domain-containing protein [Acidimicrobiales bacterium]